METLRFGLIGREDIKVGTGTFEVELADGRIVTLSELDIGKILAETTGLKGYTKAQVDLLTATAGRTARVTDDVRGIALATGDQWLLENAARGVPVEWFGALGNDSADDTTAIQAAINALGANGGILLFRRGGIYRVTDLFINNHGIHLMGPLRYRGMWHGDTGRGAVLKRTTAGGILTFDFSGAEANQASVSGLAFEGSSTGSYITVENGGNAIQIHNSSFHGKDTAVTLSGNTYDILIERNMFDTHAASHIIIDNSTGTGNNTIRILKNNFRNDAPGTATGSAIRVQGSTRAQGYFVEENIFAQFNAASTDVVNFVAGTNLVDNINVTRNHFEGFTGAGAFAIRTKGQGGYIGGNTFSGGVNGISIADTSGVVVGPNYYTAVTGDALTLDATSFDNIVMLQATSRPIVNNAPTRNTIWTTPDVLTTSRFAVSNFSTAGTPILGHFSATATYDPPNLTAGTQTTTTIAAPETTIGDPVVVGFSRDLQGMQLTGYVSVAGTITVVLRNGTGGAIDLDSGTLRVDTWRH